MNGQLGCYLGVGRCVCLQVEYATAWGLMAAVLALFRVWAPGWRRSFSGELVWRTPGWWSQSGVICTGSAASCQDLIEPIIFSGPNGAFHRVASDYAAVSGPGCGVGLPGLVAGYAVSVCCWCGQTFQFISLCDAAEERCDRS